jgi:hypothetical protein
MDPEFRVEQEAQSYGRHYAWIYRNTKDCNLRFRHLNTLSHILAGPLYGKAVAGG